MVPASIHRLGRTGSTQDVLHELAAAGAPAGTAVVAEEQTGGRGRRGRRWVSARGGLWLSMLYRPTASAGVEVLSPRVGLAVARALEEAAPLPLVGLKWPNDLVHEGRKLGGVLSEARWRGTALEWVAVGVGVNVTNRPPVDVRYEATSLAELRPGVSLAAVTDAVVAALRALDVEPGLLDERERAAFDRRDWLAGRRLREPVDGIAAGLEPGGALRVRCANGEVETVRAGTVVLA